MMKLLRAAACLATLLVAGESSRANLSEPQRAHRRRPIPPAARPMSWRAWWRRSCRKRSASNSTWRTTAAPPAPSGPLASANAPADGYTLLFVTPDFIVQPVVKAKPPFDPIKGFAPVTLLAAAPEMIAANPSLPARTCSELIAFLKANPGKHSYATPGAGSPPHLGGEWLYKVTYGLDVVHVPFQGAAPAITSTIAGHTSMVHLAMPALTRTSRTASCARSP